MILPVIRAGTAVTLVWSFETPALIPGQTPTLENPPTTPTITILDARGNITVNAAAMALIQTGYYSYEYLTPSDGVLGTWSAFVDTTDSTGNKVGSASQAAPGAKATPVFQLV